MVLKTCCDELLPLLVGLVCEGRIEDGLFQLRMQLKLDKEFRNNPLPHGLIIRLIIALKESAHPAVISFEHLNGIGGLDKVVMSGGTIVLHDILLRHCYVKQPCSQSEREPRCQFGYRHYLASSVPLRRGAKHLSEAGVGSRAVSAAP